MTRARWAGLGYAVLAVLCAWAGARYVDRVAATGPGVPVAAAAGALGGASLVTWFLVTGAFRGRLVWLVPLVVLLPGRLLVDVFPIAGVAWWGAFAGGWGAASAVSLTRPAPPPESALDRDDHAA